MDVCLRDRVSRLRGRSIRGAAGSPGAGEVEREFVLSQRPNPVRWDSSNSPSGARAQGARQDKPVQAVAAGTGTPGHWGAGALGHGKTGAQRCCAVLRLLLVLLARAREAKRVKCRLCVLSVQTSKRRRGETSSALLMRKCRGKLARLAARGADQLTLNPVVPACACAALERRTACSSWQSSGMQLAEC